MKPRISSNPFKLVLRIKWRVWFLIYIFELTEQNVWVERIPPKHVVMMPETGTWDAEGDGWGWGDGDVDLEVGGEGGGGVEEEDGGGGLGGEQEGLFCGQGGHVFAVF